MKSEFPLNVWRPHSRLSRFKNIPNDSKVFHREEFRTSVAVYFCPGGFQLLAEKTDLWPHIPPGSWRDAPESHRLTAWSAVRPVSHLRADSVISCTSCQSSEGWQTAWLHPEPWVLHPEPWVLNPGPWVLNPELWVLNPEPWILNPGY